MSALDRAAAWYEERARSVGQAAAAGGTFVPDDVSRLLLVGMDVDPHEVEELVRGLATWALEAMAAGAPPRAVLEGMYEAGFMVGYRFREEQEADRG